MIAIVAAVSGVLLLGLVVACCCFWRKKAGKKRQFENTPSSQGDVLPFRARKHPALSSPQDQRLDGNRMSTENDLDLPLFDLEVIMAATDNFSEDSKIGQGGFGPVYMVG